MWASLVGSDDKESAYNAGDPGSIPGLGRSPGEGIGYPLQYSWASLVAQLVKNPPAMWETWVWSLGWEDTLEKGMATHSSILAWRILWTVWSMGSQRVGHNWATFTWKNMGLKCIRPLICGFFSINTTAYMVDWIHGCETTNIDQRTDYKIICKFSTPPSVVKRSTPFYQL